MQMSDSVQKVLLAVGAGLALILSIIALVVALNASDRHGGGHREGGMFGDARQGQIGGGPGQHGPGGSGERQEMTAPGADQQAPSGAGAGTTTTK